MPSGKQLSFQHGEISPLQKFKSNSPSYSEACEKLYNMHVRRTGGISNRAGTIQIGNLTDGPDNDLTSLLQNNFDELLGEGDTIPIRTFVVKVRSENYYTVSVVRDPSDLTTFYIFVSDNLNPGFGGINYFKFDDPIDLERLELTYFKGVFIFTPSNTTTSFGFGIDGTKALLESRIGNPGISDINFSRDNILAAENPLPGNLTSTIGSTRANSPPIFPVSYLITVEFENGIEAPARSNSVEVDSSGNVVGSPTFSYPVSLGNTWARNTIFFGTSDATGLPKGVKYVNFYRAAEGGLSGQTFQESLKKAYKFVGRVAVEEGDGYDNGPSDFKPITFVDYGEVDGTYSPSVHSNLVNSIGGVDYAECASVYQQRLYMGLRNIRNFDDKRLSEGDIIASKIGQGSMMFTPVISRNTESFKFEVPVERSNKVVSLLSDRRMVAFTEEGVFYFAGQGEQGIITPETVNPIRVSSEGCSNRIRAKKIQNIAAYINNTHQKLMALKFTTNNISEIGDISYLSEHLITPDICRMETITESNGDSRIYILKRDGTLVIATITDTGVAGFSRYDLPNAKIVDIFPFNFPKTYSKNYLSINKFSPSMGLMVKRSNYLSLEILDERLDENEKDTVFLDHAIKFGSKLSILGSEGYYRISIGLDSTPLISTESPIQINLTAADFTSGNPITLSSDSDLNSLKYNDDVAIRFFYEDSKGRESYITLQIDWDTWSAGSPNTVTGYCSLDVPEPLQDVESKAISDIDKKAIKTRWLPCIKNWSELISEQGLKSLYASIDPTSKFDYSANEMSLVDGSYNIGLVADDRIISAPLDIEDSGNQYIRSDAGTVSLNPFNEYHAYGYIGIPYESSMETLPVEPADSRTMTDSKKIINQVGLALYNSENPYLGDVSASNEELIASKTRNVTDISISDTLFSGHIAPNIGSKWTQEGRIKVKNLNPAPLTILSIYPKGISGE